MKYIVTGGSGFIGSHSAEYLSNNSHGVTIFDHHFTGKKQNPKYTFESGLQETVSWFQDQ
jgi:UDP-glucose 4-epimerase